MPNDLDIAGTVSEFASLRSNILELLSSNSLRLAVDADLKFDPAPYQFAIPCLVIEKSDGPTKVSVIEKSMVVVAGSPDNLERFASFFWFDPNVPAGAHAHYEYYDGNESIDPRSVPLVISIR